MNAKNGAKKEMKLFKKNGAMYRTVASFVTVLFVFSGIPAPVSLADMVLITDDTNRPAATVTLAQANAKQTAVSPEVPSGSAIQNPSPLSLGQGKSQENTKAAASQANAQTANATTASVPAVPSGWTRTEGNANFAFQTRVSGEPRLGRFNYTLYLMDLRSGAETDLVVYGEFTGVSSVGSMVYVSPDGAHVFCSRNVYSSSVGLGNGWEVVADGRAILQGTLGNVQFAASDTAQVTVTQNGQTKTYEIELATGYIKVPAGWTRAVSNAYYAFQVSGSGSMAVLKVKDLLTGAETELIRVDGSVPYPAHIDSNYDVLADGSAVIYGTTQPPYGSTTYVQKMGTSAGKITLQGYVTSTGYNRVSKVLTLNLENTVSVNPSWNTRTVYVDIGSFSELKNVFNGAGYGVYQSSDAYYLFLEGYWSKVSEISPANGDSLVETVRASQDMIFLHWRRTGATGTKEIYQLYNMRYSYPVGFYVSITEQEYLQNAIPMVPTGWTRATSNARFAFQVRSEKINGSNATSLYLLDLNTGKEQLLIAGVAGSTTIPTIYDVSPDGTAVIFSYTSAGVSKTAVKLLADTTNQNVFYLDGVLSGISFENNGQVVKLTLTSGVSTWVALNTLKVVPPPVPADWTRATSNENFAFRLTGNPTMKTLSLMDLTTGKVQTVTVVRGNEVLAQDYDVSPDGSTVVYGVSSTVYIQKIANSAKKLIISGKLKDVSFDGNLAVITKTDGKQVWVDMTSLKAVPRPVPTGWTAVPSISTLAYQVISGNQVRVMDLWTGNVSEKPTSQNQGSIRSGLYYVITETGLKEIYSVRVGRSTVLKSYDPVTKKWEAYTA
ncbi:MAG TPA: hypothetical protein PLL75_01730 [Candidatus Omnitrophota bacterium]|nr:hypothetical protein [Candidatus Omnitrophota bacterium]HPS36434.1 hypothetical protein [Candidatus Omnitrophota bacterium]